MTIDHLSPQAPTWRQGETTASPTLRTEAARDLRRWADEERQNNNDVLADDYERLACYADDYVRRLCGEDSGSES